MKSTRRAARCPWRMGSEKKKSSEVGTEEYRLGLCFGLHEDEFPLAGEGLLKSGEILGFVVCQLEALFVLHRPLA